MASKRAVAVYDGFLKEIPDTDNVHNTVNAYVHDQLVASDTWNITHNLGRFPTVTVRDSALTVVVGNVQYTNTNTLVITFSGAFSGVAYLV